MIVRHRTDIGLVRPQNEDALLMGASGLYIVADGMGGHLAGEVASRMAVDTLRELLEGTEVAPRALSDAVRTANQRIFEAATKDRSRSGMGTTLTALWVARDQVLIAQVGDSRAYLFRSGVLHRCTRDHSLVDDMLRAGTITQEQARRHPQRSVITRALGTTGRIAPDIFEWDRRPGDIWLLCSDGLTDMVEDRVIAQTMLTQPYEAVCDTLLNLAMAGGGTDNITVLTLLDQEEVSA